MKPNKHRIRGKIIQRRKGENAVAKATNMIKHIEDYSTKDLVKELQERIGVTHFTIAPYDDIKHCIDEDFEGKTGPAIILVVED